MRWSWLGLTALLGCTPASTLEPTPELTIVGSDSMTDMLLPRLVDAYSDNVDLRIVIDGGGSTDGLRALLEGDADMAASARVPTPAEVDQATVFGWSFERHLVGLNVVAISVHPSNPLQSLTWEQTRQIFCTGRLRDWGELGLEERPIRVLVRNERSGSREALEDFFCGVEGIAHAHEALTADKITAELERDPDVITFAPLSDRKGKVLSLRQGADSDPVAPSQANAIRGKYPLTHDLALFTAGLPSARAKAFLDWIASPPGQHEVDEAWVVPLYLRAALLEGPRPLRETISFADASLELDERSAARLEVLLEELRSRSGEINHLILEGYADAGEPDPLTLSYRRASVVREKIAAEIPAIFFEIIPRGAKKQLAPSDTPLGQARNRSVRIYFGEEEQVQSTIAVVQPGQETED